MSSTEDDMLDLPPEIIGDSKLNLGDRKLERMIEELAVAPPKLHALRDEMEHMAKQLHGVLSTVNDLEVAIGDLDSEIMSTGYEQQSVDEQVAELPPELARVRKATSARVAALEQCARDFEIDNESKVNDVLMVYYCNIYIIDTHTLKISKYGSI
jgi:septal ring factor EnvC (AmiA/AmiB activator)